MKHSVRLAATLLISILLPLTSFAEKSAEKALRVGMNISKPMAFMQDGKAQGFEVEMVQALADKLGVKNFEWKEYHNPNEVIAALKSGDIDLGMGGITRTGQREREIDFVHHHGDFGLAIAVRMDDNEIFTEKDLKDKNVCTKGGTTSVPQAKKYGAKLTEVDDIEKCWPLLESNKVQAVFFDSAPLWHHVAHNGKGKYQVIDKLFAIQYYALLLPNKSEAKEDWDVAVSEFLFTDPYEKLWTKYMGEFE